MCEVNKYRAKMNQKGLSLLIKKIGQKSKNLNYKGIIFIIIITTKQNNFNI